MNSPPVSVAPPAPDERGSSTSVTIPAGTSIAMVLTHPMWSKSVRRGDSIYAQTTAPVVVDDQLIIPAGTFVQGKLEKAVRNGSRGDLHMLSMAVVFPNGYIATLTAPTDFEGGEGTAWRDPGNGAKVGAIVAPMFGLGIGAAIGSAAHTTTSSTLGGNTITASSPKGLAIGSMVGLVAGGVVSFALLLHSHQFVMETGSPIEATLPQPFTLASSQVADAVRQAAEHPQPPPPVLAVPPPVDTTPIDHGTCYTPGSPGTPDTVIPGTPPIGDSPGTPATVIPGIPPTPPTPYPCP